MYKVWPHWEPTALSSFQMLNVLWQCDYWSCAIKCRIILSLKRLVIRGAAEDAIQRIHLIIHLQYYHDARWVNGNRTVQNWTSNHSSNNINVIVKVQPNQLQENITNQCLLALFCVPFIFVLIFAVSKFLRKEKGTGRLQKYAVAP